MAQKSEDQIIECARGVLESESKALAEAASQLNRDFIKAVQLIENCRSRVVVTGLGKSGHIGRKLAATFASTGTPSFFLHPSEALHGDLGMLTAEDCVLALAYSGETKETIDVARFAKRLNVPLIVMSGKNDSTLAKLADVVLQVSVNQEACPLNLAPTVSTTLMLALGDALAISMMEKKGFGEMDFAQLHPAGSLGRRLLTVADVMRPMSEVGTIAKTANFEEVMHAVTRSNFGVAVVLSDNEKQILGVITDGDIRRAISNHRGEALKMSAGDLMGKNPKQIDPQRFAVEGFQLMEKFKVTSLIVSQEGHFLGILRMHDLLDRKIL